MAAPSLDAVLSSCSSIDNGIRKAGEANLKQFSKSPDFLAGLLHCAQAGTDLQVI